MLRRPSPVARVGRVLAFAGCLLAGVWPARTQESSAEPELPQIYIDSSYTPPTGATIVVRAGGDLQGALNRVQPGEVIALEAGATFRGNFTLPRKTGNGWVVIRSTADASLPPPGTRVGPANANLMPKIVSPNAEPAIATAPGAHHYRLIGLEVTVAAGVQQIFGLIDLGSDRQTLSEVPYHLILDRMYIHGSPTQTVRRGITLNSAYTAIIDSYISDCHEMGSDSQAIGGWNGPGPFKIVNNYLEGAGENFILGGADPSIPNLISSDVEFRRNDCFKPLSWRRGEPSFAGRPWSVKNLFELKNAQRVLIDGNVFENNWLDAQNGYGILFTVRNQDGGAPWATVQDVTFTNNVVRHAGGGINMHGQDDNRPSQQSRRFKIANNLFEDIDGRRWGGPGVFLQVAAVPDVQVHNNTILQGGNLVVAGQAPSRAFVFLNNIAPHNEFGIFGDARGPGNVGIRYYFPDGVFRKNVIAGADAEAYPTDNFYPSSLSQVGFQGLATGNYRLAPSSRYKNAGTDGRDPGCDFDALQRARTVLPPRSLTTVSAASYRRGPVAVESIVSGFAADLTSFTAAAASFPLPVSLRGTSVQVRDSAGDERVSPLFFVSPSQVNYQVPAGTAPGPAIATVFYNGNRVAIETLQVTRVAPSLFTANGTGQGVPAAFVVRVQAEGTQSLEPVALYDEEQRRFVPAPIDLGPSTDLVFLNLYGTGIRLRNSLSGVSVRIGGIAASVPYAGPQGDFVGLDQVNVLLPRELAERGEVELQLTVDGQAANPVRIFVQ
jgi:uncharacterized protein (TIGR03437 family)